MALKDELEFLQKYLEIEQARFGDRLSVDFDIEPETLDAQVPNLILQPLVENSVRHAVAVRIEPGHIEIRRPGGSTIAGARRCATTGPGMPPDALASPASRRGPGEHTLAARAAVRRLQHLTFAEPPGGGLIVTVSLPFKADEVAEIDDFPEDIKGVA